jgi:hypothetical protein
VRRTDVVPLRRTTVVKNLQTRKLTPEEFDETWRCREDGTWHDDAVVDGFSCRYYLVVPDGRDAPLRVLRMPGVCGGLAERGSVHFAETSPGKLPSGTSYLDALEFLVEVVRKDLAANGCL